MPDLSTIRAQVQDRLKELERLIAPLRAEIEELTSVAERFTSNGASAPVKRARGSKAAKPRAATPKATPRAKSGTRRRASGGVGGRAQQAVKLIAEHPGMTVPEMAKAMGIGSNYLYRVLPRLEKDGKVSKRAKGYHPVDAKANAEAPAPKPS
jgi:hypothetical protein